jgi:hypothetical protein
MVSGKGVLELSAAAAIFRMLYAATKTPQKNDSRPREKLKQACSQPAIGWIQTVSVDGLRIIKLQVLQL